MNIYRIWVGVSDHDRLKEGVLVAEWHYVVVAAAHHLEAELVACGMAAAHGMPTELFHEI